jgi:hypothetical protein
MVIKIKITDPEMIKEMDEFFVKEKSQRVCGRGSLGDSWIIAHHLQQLSKEKLNQDVTGSNLTGIHLFLGETHAIVSAVNFPDNSTIVGLSGRSFKHNVRWDGVLVSRSFTFGSIVENFQFPLGLDHGNMVPVTIFMNSTVFEITPSSGEHDIFYYAITQDLSLLKDLGRRLLPDGEPCLDHHLMDFECPLPGWPSDVQTDIGKEFLDKLRVKKGESS